MGKLEFKEEDFSVIVPDRIPPQWEGFIKNVESQVFGQERAIRKAVQRLIVASSGIQNTERPPSPLLFAGPPGSGKTMLAEVLAKEWIGEPKGSLLVRGEMLGPIVKISGENYTQSHEGSALKGSPAGYVGYEDKSPLEDIGLFDYINIAREFNEVFSEWVANNKLSGAPRNIIEPLEKKMEELLGKRISKFAPFRSVFLIDEFEKMHPHVQKMFLGILDRGEFELLNGRKIDFRGSLIILTSNIGTGRITKHLDGHSIGFAPPRDSKEKQEVDQEIYEMLKEDIKKNLDPAIYSRIGNDGIVVFHSLSMEDYERIINSEMAKLQKAFSGDKGRGALILRVSDAFNKFILNKADAKREGARQIGRLLDKYAKQKLANAIEGQQIKSGDCVLFDVENDEVVLRRVPRPKNIVLPPINMGTREVTSKTKGEIVRSLNRYFRTFIKPILDAERKDDEQKEKPDDEK